MYTLHPDKLVALQTTIGKKPKPAAVPAPATAPRRTYDMRRPSLIENLAARLYNAQGGGAR